METPTDRIRRIQHLRGLSQTDIATAARVKPSAVNQWLSGNTSPSLASLRAVAKHLKIRREWLETGRGPMQDGDSELQVAESSPTYVTDATRIDRARLEVVAAAVQASPEVIDGLRRVLGLPPMDQLVVPRPIAPIDALVTPKTLKPMG